jgi:hypothetical protein
MEQVLTAGIGVPDTYFWEALLAALGIAVGLVLAFFSLGGNTLLVLLGLGFSFFDGERFFDARLITALILVYALGELWEFAVSFFGIKTERVPWWGVFLIGCGTLTGGLLGTMYLPVFGSLLGAAARFFPHGICVRVSSHTGCEELQRACLAGGKDAMHCHARQVGGCHCPGYPGRKDDFLLRLSMIQ